MQKIGVKISAAYMEEPIMIKDTDIYHHYETSSLPISKELVSLINVWDSDYKDTFDASYPPDSGFKTEEDLIHHNRRGEEICRLLQIELGEDYCVKFYPTRRE